MALAIISLKPPPNVDPTKATLAYGRLAIKRINRELKDTDLTTRQRAVKALCDYLHDPEHIEEAVNEEHAIGRTVALRHNILESFEPLLDFNQPDVIRLNTHRAIELLTTNLTGVQAIIEAKYIDLLVKCVEKEVDEIKIIVLNTLYHCFSFETEEGLNAGGIPLFTKLLTHSNTKIRTRAAQNILRLCVNLRGKQEALDNETIPALVSMLNDPSEDLKAFSAGALGFICTTNHGRYTTLNAGAIPLLLNLIDDKCSRVRVNTFKVLTCLSETPEGRRILLDHLNKISPHVTDMNAAVAKHAKIALSVITWQP
uniref:Rhabdoid tumor deletion region protein 1 n=1 Tax=Schistosoma haematobium TaxID=6185 RepID=A0A094ZTW9_SCHHA